MWSPELEEEWTRLTDELLAEVKAWRVRHPQATLYEIEVEVDARMGAARSRLLEAAARASPVEEPSDADDRPMCPACDAPMHWDGTRTRRLTTAHNRDVTLTRRHARRPVPALRGWAFPPWMRDWACCPAN